MLNGTCAPSSTTDSGRGPLWSVKRSMRPMRRARARVMELGAARFLRTPGEPFDGVFLDPPFGQAALEEYVPWLDAGRWVKTGGWVYLEHERSAGVPALPPHWQLLKSKSAGEAGYHLARVTARASNA